MIRLLQIYGQILDRLIENSPDVYHRLQEYGKKLSTQIPDLLQTMVWEYLVRWRRREKEGESEIEGEGEDEGKYEEES